jgi:hypothetical protein
MDWKEHVGWLSPNLATAVAFVVVRFGPRLAQPQEEQRSMRRMLTVLFRNPTIPRKGTNVSIQDQGPRHPAPKLGYPGPVAYTPLRSPRAGA